MSKAGVPLLAWANEVCSALDRGFPKTQIEEAVYTDLQKVLPPYRESDWNLLEVQFFYGLTTRYVCPEYLAPS